MELKDFRISTGLKDIIGKELITDDRIAIFELVKNSYDAKAGIARILFENVKRVEDGNSKEGREGQEEPRILIADDGAGMSKRDLEKKWLFVGYSEKKSERHMSVTDYRRKVRRRERMFAGAKGIGRFSADRLGGLLTIYTKKSSEELVHCLKVDWTKFEKTQEKEFETVKVEYSELRELPLPDHEGLLGKHGTLLLISNLNSGWDRPKLLKLKNYLRRLVNPAAQPDKSRFRIELVANEFIQDDEGKEDYERINGYIENPVFEKLDELSTKIRCMVSKDSITTTLTDKGRRVFTLQEKNTYTELSDIEITVYYMNEQAKSAFTRMMGVQPKNYGSIFLYKNGFRIHPYGDEDNDWLGLDRRKTQAFRRNLGNRDLAGRIVVYGPQPGFQEVSSRDAGVVHSVALEQLALSDGSLFKEKVLKRMERYVVGAIDWGREIGDTGQTVKDPEDIKVSSLEVIDKIVGGVDDPDKKVDFDTNLLQIVEERQLEKMPELIRNVEHISEFVGSRPEKEYLQQQLRSMRRTTARLERDANEGKLALEVKNREALFLQKELSADKDTFFKINHSIELATRRVKSQIDRLNETLSSGPSTPEIIHLVDAISMENQKIAILASVVSLANFNAMVKTINGDLVAYIVDYVERVMGTRPEKIGHKFVNQGIRYRTAFRPLEVSIILDNLISNSKKNGANLVTIRFGLRQGKLTLRVGDNGDGVLPENARFLFTRGFTTTHGSGLGLYHLSELAEGMNGSIEFLGNGIEGMGKGACFELVLEKPR